MLSEKLVSSPMKRLLLALLIILTLAIIPAWPVFAALPAPARERALRADFTTCAAQSEIPAAECEALTSLYSAAGGASWSNHTDWLATDTPCSWYGVTCESGHVTQLGLNGNNLSGALPAALGDLTELQILRLFNNKLSGAIPAELGGLSALQTLNLTSNQLSGAIPAALGSLSALQTLNLSNNQLSGAIPAALNGMTALRYGNLSANGLSGAIPAELGSLTNLQQLLVSNNQLSGAIPAALGGMSGLQTLNLETNQLSGTIPAELGSLANLTNLTLSNNALSGTIPASLGGLSALAQLSLANNALSGAIPAELGSLSSLNRLELYGNQLSGAIPAELGSLSSLQYLILGHNQLSGHLPSQLGGLANLQQLSVLDNPLSGAIPESFTSLTSLTLFRFNSTALCEPASSAFQAWKATVATWLGTAVCYGKTAPADGQYVGPASPTLSWGAMTPLHHYEYCVDTSDDDACSTAWVNNGVNTSAALSGLNPNSTYFWQVRAKDTAGNPRYIEADDGAWWSFTTANSPLPAAFNKTAPANNATAQPLSPTLSWSASGGAASYEYCLSASGASCPGNNWSSAGTNLSAALSGLAYNTTYHWQARAVNSSGTTYANGGTWWQFTTTQALPVNEGTVYLPMVVAASP